MSDNLVFDVEACRNFVRAQHAGQVDKVGRDYYQYHLCPIADSVSHLGEKYVIAALLHDWIEDCRNGDIEAASAELRSMNVPEPVISAVVSVTRIPGETYKNLIRRSCADPIGVHIKLADNGYNIKSNPELAVQDYKLADSMLKNRYLPARDRLIAARTLHMLDMFSEEYLERVLGK